MPIVPPSRAAVDALLARLGDPRAATRDAAAARLRLFGEQALRALAAWLPGATPVGRHAAVAVVEALGDPRAAALLADLCGDADEAVALRAAEAAGDVETGAPALVAALAARVTGPARPAPDSRLRRAALDALVQLHRRGAVPALAPLLDVLLDPHEDDALRVAAAAAVDDLAPRERRVVLARLAARASPALRARLDLTPGGPRPAPRGLLQALARLRRGGPPAAAPPPLDAAATRPAGDVARDVKKKRPAAPAAEERRDTRPSNPPSPGPHPLGAATQPRTARPADGAAPTAPPQAETLAAHGAAAVMPMAEALRRRPPRSDGEAERIAAALASIGPAAVPALQRALDALSNAGTRGAPARAAAAACAEAKAVLHQALARLDSRIALYDLREMLAARPPRALHRLLPTAAALGDASVAAELARLVAASAELRDACVPAFTAIVTRERLTRRSRAFGSLPAGARAALAALWPRGTPARPRRG